MAPCAGSTTPSGPATSRRSGFVAGLEALGLGKDADLKIKGWSFPPEIRTTPSLFEAVYTAKSGRELAHPSGRTRLEGGPSRSRGQVRGRSMRKLVIAAVLALLAFVRRSSVRPGRGLPAGQAGERRHVLGSSGPPRRD
ncbi:MAG: hypothetical protein M0C28_27270 [Candidatus Moduliflexus flocculans]|nr:hypothetical protein [Candidatus Moduliflexus flocculans]